MFNTSVNAIRFTRSFACNGKYNFNSFTSERRHLLDHSDFLSSAENHSSHNFCVSLNLKVTFLEPTSCFDHAHITSIGLRSG